MKKYKFIVTSIKKNIIPLTFLFFIVCLVIFSNSNLSAARNGLFLWANKLVPSLLPFFIATELLSYTDIVHKFGKLLNPIMMPLFNVPGIASFALIMGIISGYPTGAKIAVDLNENGLCTREEAERMLAFTNNSGPLFILSTVGISMFGNSQIGILLLVTHILACITVGIIFRFYKCKTYNTNNLKVYSTNKELVSFSNLGDILGKAITSSVKTMIMIGGFVVLFSIILSILKNSNIINILSKTLFPLFKMFGINDIQFSNAFISGIIELTNGVMQISSIQAKTISINIILSAFLLGFGGFSVLLQVSSIISKANISIKSYFIGKLLHGIIAAFYTFLFITYFPIFNLDL